MLYFFKDYVPIYYNKILGLRVDGRWGGYMTGRPSKGLYDVHPSKNTILLLLENVLTVDTGRRPRPVRPPNRIVTTIILLNNDAPKSNR